MAELKLKKKKFVKIIAPKQFNEQTIGESMVTDQRLLLQRKMKINMMSLTDNPKNQIIQIGFNINSLRGDSVGTEIISYTLQPAYVKRIVRKDKRRADYNTIVKTNDNKKIVIKSLMLTLNKTTKPVLTALRKKANELLLNKVASKSYDDLIGSIISHRLQMELKKELSKIYPLRQFEVRDMKIITEKKQNFEEKQAVKPKKESYVKEEAKSKEEDVPEKKVESTQENPTVQKEESADVKQTSDVGKDAKTNN